MMQVKRFRRFIIGLGCCSGVLFIAFTTFIRSTSNEVYSSNGYEVNNWGENDNLLVLQDRQRDAKESELKTILMWNDAYGVREYDIGHGREPFYKFRCPETRCVATSNR